MRKIFFLIGTLTLAALLSLFIEGNAGAQYYPGGKIPTHSHNSNTAGGIITNQIWLGSGTFSNGLSVKTPFAISTTAAKSPAFEIRPATNSILALTISSPTAPATSYAVSISTTGNIYTAGNIGMGIAPTTNQLHIFSVNDNLNIKLQSTNGQTNLRLTSGAGISQVIADNGDLTLFSVGNIILRSDGARIDIQKYAATQTRLIMDAPTAYNNSIMFRSDGAEGAYVQYEGAGVAGQKDLIIKISTGTTAAAMVERARFKYTGDVQFSATTATTTISGWVDFGLTVSSAAYNAAGRVACPTGSRILSGGCAPAPGTYYMFASFASIETDSSASAAGTPAGVGGVAYSWSCVSTASASIAQAICARIK